MYAVKGERHGRKVRGKCSCMARLFRKESGERRETGRGGEIKGAGQRRSVWGIPGEVIVELRALLV